MAGSSYDPYGGVPSLQEALSSFVQGARDLSVSRALQDANAAVQQIKISGESDAKQRAQLGQVAQGLVMQMTGLGANAASVANVYSALKPTTPANGEAAVMQGLAEGNDSMVALGRKAQAINREDELGKMQAQADISANSQARLFNHQLDMMSQKQNVATQKLQVGELRKTQATFQKQASEIEKASLQARSAIKLLSSKGPAADLQLSAVQTMLARASGEVGNLTEMERAAFTGKQDIYSKLARMTSKTTLGKLTSADKAALLDLAKLYSGSAQEMLADRAEMLTNQYVEAFGADPAETMKKITGGKIAPRNQSSGFSAPNPSAPAPTTQVRKPGFTFYK